MDLPILVTPRLKLRAFRMTDVEDFYEYARNPEVGPNAGWKPHENIAESATILRSWVESDKATIWALEHRESGRVIGSIGLHQDRFRPRDSVRMVGYVLAQPYWGQGLMPEAVKEILRHGFEDRGLEMMTIMHFPFNDRSRRVIEKCGFRYEGRLRRANMLHDASPVDECCYSILREEYNEIR